MEASISAAPLESVTTLADAYDAIRAELRSVTAGHPELFPRDGHSDHFHRMMLAESDTRALHLRCALGILINVQRRFGAAGTEAVNRILAPLHALFGDNGPGFLRAVQAIDTEQLQSCVVFAEATVLTDEAERMRDPAKARAALLRYDHAKAEITDVQRAIRRHLL